MTSSLQWKNGGMEWLKKNERDFFLGIWCGSFYGNFRNIIGVENSAYLLMDDEPLFDEILDTYGELCYRNVEYVLKHVGGVFDFAPHVGGHLLQDRPAGGAGRLPRKVGPHYKRVTDLLKKYGIDIVSPGLRWVHRCPGADLAGERRQHHVPDRGRHVEREHRAVAEAVWQGDPRRGRDEQGGLRAGPGGH